MAEKWIKHHWGDECKFHDQQRHGSCGGNLQLSGFKCIWKCHQFQCRSDRAARHDQTNAHHHISDQWPEDGECAGNRDRHGQRQLADQQRLVSIEQWRLDSGNQHPTILPIGQQWRALAAGTNSLNAFAFDLGGNFSATNSVSFVSSNTFKLQINFTLAQPLTATGLNFSLQISPGLNGHIQVSTNLANWAALTNFVGTNATLNFRDTAATNSNRRFYRAVIP